MQRIRIETKGCFQGEVVERKNGVEIRKTNYDNDLCPQYDFCKKNNDTVEISFNGVKSDDFKIVIAVEPRDKDLFPL